jgi:hypothetical protein
MVQNGGFCNGGITERCLYYSRKVLYNDLISQLSMMKDGSNKNKMLVIILFFLKEGQLVGAIPEYLAIKPPCRVETYFY